MLNSSEAFTKTLSLGAACQSNKKNCHKAFLKSRVSF